MIEPVMQGLPSTHKPISIRLRASKAERGTRRQARHRCRGARHTDVPPASSASGERRERAASGANGTPEETISRRTRRTGRKPNHPERVSQSWGVITSERERSAPRKKRRRPHRIGAPMTGTAGTVRSTAVTRCCPCWPCRRPRRQPLRPRFRRGRTDRPGPCA